MTKVQIYVWKVTQKPRGCSAGGGALTTSCTWVLREGRCEVVLGWGRREDLGMSQNEGGSG